MTEIIFPIAGACPIVWLFLALCVMRLPGHKACAGGLALAALLALFVMRADPQTVAGAALDGLAFALWPILLVILSAMILYKYSVLTGGMDRIKMILAGISTDKRILALVLAWGFGAFLEGIAGFGVPVLIPGAILVSLGFSPMASVVACLVANSAPTPFATVGIPTLTLSSVTGLDAGVLGFNVALQLLIPCLLVPFVLVMLVGGGARALKGVWRIALIAGLSFALPMLLITRFIGPELPTLLGGFCSIACVAMASKRLYRDSAYDRQFHITPMRPQDDAVPISAFQAALPFGIVLVLVLATSFTKPVTPGLLILISTALSCIIQGRRLKELLVIARNTLFESWKMCITIIAIVAMAKIMDYSGMTDAIAIVLIAVFASFYPLVAPFIGTLGTFITGSDTTCAILFGNLQAGAARAIGADPSWIAAANLAAAASGKMISPQSIAVGLRIGGLDGREGEILRQTLKYALICTGIISIITFGVHILWF